MRRFKTVLLLFLALLGVVSGETLLRFRETLAREAAALADLSALTVSAYTETARAAPEKTDAVPTAESAAPGENEARFAPLTAENDDFAAWLTIPGTAVDYPVMTGDFYLDHGFDKTPSVSGVPFLDARCTAEDQSVLIHAHNMRDGGMFALLPLYEDEEFCREHPTILFDTPERSGEYAVFAAFRTETDAPFRYYDYAGAITAEESAEYIAQLRAAALYDTGVAAAPGDELLTLSTCAYHAPGGRFVVAAVRIK